jgi:quinol monooxygenase YgiN
MNKLQVTARLKIHKGQLGDFKAVAKKCLRIVQDKDKGTLQYDWFLDEDAGVCLVQEQYRDSNAVLEHVANLGETMSELLSHADMELDVCGDPSPELMKAAESMKVSLYRYFQGL